MISGICELCQKPSCECVSRVQADIKIKKQKEATKRKYNAWAYRGIDVRNAPDNTNKRRR